MKFLVDAHLPRRLVYLLREMGFEAAHTLDLALGNRTPDSVINELSIREQYIVITKDADARILRGDIYWADLDPTRGHKQSGRRPVLILSQYVFNSRSGTVIAVALTSQEQKAGFPLTLELSSVSLPKKTWVKISQIRPCQVRGLV